MDIPGITRFKRFAVACDHGAFELKNRIVSHLRDKGYAADDLTPVYENPIPFVDMAVKCCGEVLRDARTLGILCCGTGMGMAIAANRIRGIHAAVLYDDFCAEYSRRHTNANVLVFGGRTMREEDVLKRIEIFLSNGFEGGKYAERNARIDLIGPDGTIKAKDAEDRR